MAAEENTKTEAEIQESLKAELRMKIRAEIERLDALYDAEMVKYIDLERRIEQAKRVGNGVGEDTGLMVRELTVVQKTRRDIGDQASMKRQELHDVDGPTLEEEYAAHLAAERKEKSPKKLKVVPPAAFINQQIDLFRDFLANTDDERSALSNAIDLWDSVPRYSISREKQKEMRVQGGFLPIVNLDFQYKGQSYMAEIRPALIKTKDKEGKTATIAFYPSGREELIEHALRKLAAEQQTGFFEGGKDFRSGVAFTLHQLRMELESMGHSMRYDELMEGLDVLNLSNIRLIDKSQNEEDPSFVSQSYFPALAKVTKAGRANDPQAKWLVQFHSALTASIAQLTYRQFNYQRLMSCQSQLSRWLLSQLVLKYTFASPGNTFKMLYSTIQRDSGLLDNYKRTRDAIDALDKAFEELKREGVFMHIKKEATTGARGKILDVLYTLAASVKFSSEQKAANKRQSSGLETLAIVDNSHKLR
jgi:hypothetical protein